MRSAGGAGSIGELSLARLPPPLRFVHLHVPAAQRTEGTTRSSVTLRCKEAVRAPLRLDLR